MFVLSEMRLFPYVEHMYLYVCVCVWRSKKTNCMFPLNEEKKRIKVFSLQRLSAGLHAYDPHNVCQCGFCPHSTLFGWKKRPSSCKHFHWKDFSNHLRPAVVFGIRVGLLAFLGYERFVLANSAGLMSTNVLSVSLRERLMLMFRPSIEGEKVNLPCVSREDTCLYCHLYINKRGTCVTGVKHSARSQQASICLMGRPIKLAAYNFHPRFFFLLLFFIYTSADFYVMFMVAFLTRNSCNSEELCGNRLKCCCSLMNNCL